ncbi:MAG: hypothetical protein COA43_06345 [Robiginitomaculum sp.]|nr:MAG: hypothetical protein COA43_06345 [Robiginitomaculum sp.]
MTSIHPEPNAKKATDLLKNTAAELQMLAHNSDHLQIIIGQIISGGANATDSQIRDLQALDHLTQSLDCLAKFMTNLSQETPSHWVYPDIQAAQCVTLASLASRLEGKIQSVQNSNDMDGDLDLF